MLEPPIRGYELKVYCSVGVYSKYQPYLKQIKKQFNTDISLLLDCCAIDQATYSREGKTLKRNQFSFENEQ
jgi:hypothetical protein